MSPSTAAGPSEVRRLYPECVNDMTYSVVCVCAEPSVFEHQHLRDLRPPAEADRSAVRGRPPLPGSLAQKVSVCLCSPLMLPKFPVFSLY